MKVFMHLPVNLCEILIPQGTASLEYEDFRIAFSVAINGNSFNCVIYRYTSYDNLCSGVIFHMTVALSIYHINVDNVVITVASY